MRKFLRNTAWVVGVIAAIVVTLRLTILRWWTIPVDDPIHGISLAPSLAAGDFVILLRTTPKYGDLVRCADPGAPGRYVVGRILATEGDKIELTRANIIVNGRPTQPEMSCNPAKITVPHPTSGAPVELHCSIEAAQGHKHLRASALTANASEVIRRGEVSQGNVYLVSDNRVFPMDSREYGAIPKASCKEQVFFRVKGKKGWGDTATRLMFIQ
ncbi:MAG: signal peptidase I [Polyangiaceae bacterium]|nr:signal peptidase I [Polyangiaceae bacterium]